MNWTLAIDINRTALLRIVAAMFAMAGLTQGGSIRVLPRHVHSKVLLILRSAESAARRLIVMKARNLPVPSHRPRPAPAGPIPRGKADASRIPAFRLIDPRKNFNRRPSRKGPGPGILVFHDPDELVPLVVKRQRAAEAQAQAERFKPKPPPDPDDPVNAERLCRRLHALQTALNDLTKQAKRLMRLEARRAQAPPGPRRAGPLRPGWPPGYRKRRIHPVDQILYDCHALAHRAFAQQTRPTLKTGPPSRGSFFAV